MISLLIINVNEEFQMNYGKRLWFYIFFASFSHNFNLEKLNYIQLKIDGWFGFSRDRFKVDQIGIISIRQLIILNQIGTRVVFHPSHLGLGSFPDVPISSNFFSSNLEGFARIILICVLPKLLIKFYSLTGSLEWIHKAIKIVVMSKEIKIK